MSIIARSLAKSYDGVIAVDGIDLDVRSGSVFGFLGPNGAGKSTTIKLLTTLVPPTSGNIEILGINAVKHPLEVRKRIGVVLQQPSYEPNLSVEKSLEKYGMMWNVERKTRIDRTEELIDVFDLGEIRKRKNEDLSIGQRRRVQVAREFMHDMDLLFLDEPTVGLDPSARRRLLDFLKNKAKTGLTIFYTTHVLTEAEYLCDEIAVLNRGRILAVDTPEQLKNTFGQQKTIKIRLSERHQELADLVHGIPDCTIRFDTGTDIIIQSSKSELVLSQILQILIENNITVEDLSAMPTTLEEIFLKMVDTHASDS
ncbi:MAG: ABC transporter ATP-binding protein [Candidatus Nitrosotenuis sp.]|uniref:ABC transporter related n=1 Tax=Candidatus Nitrosotenuis uzonensis TaxID=1407055 RepID=A0A812F4U6_9ARCH|nr:ABC transporter ATP-binding protein [Candidatus Nitrosotenuis uzonensis]MCA2003896.1 ABC transporter ATP-binding protein [Candidatus Nitrosotenuis sp.]CAE6488529.1 ABC transporter related [Candidatus Nitrosotenuis uzonensis]